MWLICQTNETMAKQPYIPLYTGDYLKDTRILPLDARGAWVDIMIFMWESKEKGTITGTMDEFALMLGCSLKKANAIIGLLHEKNICDYALLPTGHIKLSSRRMIRDAVISALRKKAGDLGGNPILVNQNSTKQKKFGYPNSDNDNESASGCLDLNKKESQQKIADMIFSDEKFVEDLRSAHREKDLRQAFSECYIHHSNGPSPPTELWQWRQKLNTWLTIKPEERKVNGKKPIKKFTTQELDS
jgi:hypothetical protein